MLKHTQLALKRRLGRGEREPTLGERIANLLGETDDELPDDQRLYCVRIGFERANAQLNDRFHVLSELEDGADIRALDPEPEDLTAADPTLEVIVATSIQPEALAESITYEFVEDVDAWEIDPEAVEPELHDEIGRECADTDAAEEFARLQQEYAERADSWEDDGALEETDPTQVQFSSDEIGFDELVASVDDEAINDGDGHDPAASADAGDDEENSEATGKTASDGAEESVNTDDGAEEGLVEGIGEPTGERFDGVPSGGARESTVGNTSPDRSDDGGDIDRSQQSIVGELVTALEAGRVDSDDLVVLHEYLAEEHDGADGFEDRLDKRERRFEDRLDESERRFEERIDESGRRIEDRLDAIERRLDEHERVHQHMYTSLFVDTA